MGACIGKKSHKYLEKNQHQPKNIKVPEIKIEDDKTIEKSSSKISLTQDASPTIDEDIVNFRESAIEQISINSEVQSIIDEQDKINEVLSKPYTNRVISTTNSELLEIELANLAFEHTNNSLNIPGDDSNPTK